MDWLDRGRARTAPTTNDVHSNKDEAADKGRRAGAPAMQTPSSSAAPPVPPDDPEDAPRKDDASSQTPRKASYRIGASDGGPGVWAKVNEGLSPEEAAYQQKATGAQPGTAYNVVNPNAAAGVTSFDGYDPATNTLIDAKYWNKWPIDEEFSSRSVIEQARNQINAAKGTKIVWRMASPEKAEKVGSILYRERITGIDIEVFLP